MRITKKQLQRIIKEELENVLSEGAFDDLIDITRKVIEKALKVGFELIDALEKACDQKALLKMAVNDPSLIEIILQNIPAQEAADALVKKVREAGAPVPLGSETVLAGAINAMKNDKIFFPQLEKALENENVRDMLVATIAAACPDKKQKQT